MTDEIDVEWVSIVGALAGWAERKLARRKESKVRIEELERQVDRLTKEMHAKASSPQRQAIVNAVIDQLTVRGSVVVSGDAVQFVIPDAGSPEQLADVLPMAVGEKRSGGGPEFGDGASRRRSIFEGAEEEIRQRRMKTQPDGGKEWDS